MRVLILGGTGQLGRSLLEISWPDGTELLSPSRKDVDVTQAHSLANCLRDFKPDYVINATDSQIRYAEQQKILTQLVEVILASAPDTLESFFLQDWQNAQTDQARLRVVIDQVASLTDPGAVALHKRLINRG